MYICQPEKWPKKVNKIKAFGKKLKNYSKSGE